MGNARIQVKIRNLGRIAGRERAGKNRRKQSPAVGPEVGSPVRVEVSEGEEAPYCIMHPPL